MKKVIIHAPISRNEYIEGLSTSFAFHNPVSVADCIEEVKRLSYKGNINLVEIENQSQ